MDRVYMAARWDKGTADYINCPMTAEEYDRFYDALVTAESVQEKEWEKLTYFEGCLPIEELARRGRDTPRFRPDEAGRLARSANREDAVGGGAVAVRKFAGRFLQPGWISESFEVQRTGSRAAADPWPGECEILALWPNPSQHLH